MKLEYTETPNPVGFESYITGPDGARFILYPVKGQHTTDDVKDAAAFLRRNRDVVHLSVEWKEATEETVAPDKIPDFLIIKGMRVELGKKEAYIEELEHKLKLKVTKESQELARDIKTEEIYRKIKEENTRLKKENLNLKHTISDLVAKNQIK